MEKIEMSIQAQVQNMENDNMDEIEMMIQQIENSQMEVEPTFEEVFISQLNVYLKTYDELANDEFECAQRMCAR